MNISTAPCLPFFRKFAYKKEEPLEFSEVFPNDVVGVVPLLDKIVFELTLPNYEQEFVSVYIRIMLDERNVGWFKHVYMVDGEDFDEYFVID